MNIEGAETLCCPVCHGSGMWAQGIDDVECHLCKGSGRVPANVRQGDDTMPHRPSVKAIRKRVRDAQR